MTLRPRPAIATVHRCDEQRQAVEDLLEKGMKLLVVIAGREWEVQTDDPFELAVSLDFRGPQPRAYGLSAAQARTVEAGGFVGDTRRGGSANCETLELTPHANGTHTEGVGHIAWERIFVADAAQQPLLPATVLTVPLRDLIATEESYSGQSEPDDQVICAVDLQAARNRVGLDAAFLNAVVVRIEPEQRPFEPLDEHSGSNPPYLTDQAVRWIRDSQCQHLLVELPSIDREDDGGLLPNHHRFFGVKRQETPDHQSRRRTLTEMIFVPAEVRDGPYVLSLRFPRLRTDAVPSRPLLYPLEERI